MAAHGLDGNGVGNRHAVLLAQIAYLCEEIAIGLVGVLDGFMCIVLLICCCY